MNLSRVKIFLRVHSCTFSITNVKVVKKNSVEIRTKLHYSSANSHTDGTSSPPKSIQTSAAELAIQFTYNALRYTRINYQIITGNDPEKLEKLKLIQQEIDKLAREGKAVPRKLQSRNWRALLNMEPEARQQHYGLLWKNRVANDINVLEEKIVRKYAKNSHIRYSFDCNTLFDKISPDQMNRMYDWKLTQVSTNEPQILIDCSYERFMSEKEVEAAAAQLIKILMENRERFNPFNIIYCNWKRDGQLAKAVEKFFPCVYEPEVPFVCTEKSFVELYPKEKLIYLTPHCNQYMETYDPDSAYIIGTFYLYLREKISSTNNNVFLSFNC